MLRQEVVRYNDILAHVATTLEDVQKTLTGTALTLGDFRPICDSLRENTVPAVWAELAGFAPKPLSSWMSELQERMEFLRKWLGQGEPKASLYWLPAFRSPHSFLAALLLTYARKHGTTADKLAFSFRVLDRSPEALEDSPRVALVAKVVGWSLRARPLT